MLTFSKNVFLQVSFICKAKKTLTHGTNKMEVRNARIISTPFDYTKDLLFKNIKN